MCLSPTSLWGLIVGDGMAIWENTRDKGAMAQGVWQTVATSQSPAAPVTYNDYWGNELWVTAKDTFPDRPKICISKTNHRQSALV